MLSRGNDIASRAHEIGNFFCMSFRELRSSGLGDRVPLLSNIGIGGSWVSACVRSVPNNLIALCINLAAPLHKLMLFNISAKLHHIALPCSSLQSVSVFVSVYMSVLFVFLSERISQKPNVPTSNVRCMLTATVARASSSSGNILIYTNTIYFRFCRCCQFAHNRPGKMTKTTHTIEATHQRDYLQIMEPSCCLRLHVWYMYYYFNDQYVCPDVTNHWRPHAKLKNRKCHSSRTRQAEDKIR